MKTDCMDYQLLSIWRNTDSAGCASTAGIFARAGQSSAQIHLRPQEYRLPHPKKKAQGVLLGKKFGLLAYSPEQDEGHILVMGPSGTGKTSALLIPTLRSWQGTALVVDISGDISANVHTENKIIFDPTAKDCIPYDVFASIDAAPDDTERQERLEQLAYLLLPDKSQRQPEAGIFFTKMAAK